MELLRFSSDGRFQVWCYVVGHGRLLIRCPNAGGAVQTDLLFVNVAALSLPTVLEGIELRELSTSDPEAIEALQQFNVKSKDVRVFIVQSLGVTGTILAGDFSLDQSQREYHESNPLMN